MTIIIETTDLNKSFGKTLAVDKVNLKVNQGDIYGFLGRNGAGKTTVIKLLMGIIAPDAGSVFLFGEPPGHISNQQKNAIGYVPQEQNFYSWMTGRQLADFVGAFYSQWDNETFNDLLIRFDVSDSKKISALSGGTRVKLALAIALAHKTELLIMDEPTAVLDPIARREFLDIVMFHAKHHKTTIFFSSHLVGCNTKKLRRY